MSGLCGPWSLWGLGRCFANNKGLASNRSTPSGNVSAKISGEMARASIGSRESQSLMVSDERSCGYCCGRRGRRCDAVVCASGSMSTQTYDRIAYHALSRASSPVASPEWAAGEAVGATGLQSCWMSGGRVSWTPPGRDGRSQQSRWGWGGRASG
jgi:hypothetical protein